MSRDGLVCILIHPTYVIDVGGKDYRFEWHEYCGPTVLDKKDNPRRPYAEGHPFWKALGKWITAGKRVDSDGRCILEPAPGPVPEVERKPPTIKLDIK